MLENRAGRMQVQNMQVQRMLEALTALVLAAGGQEPSPPAGAGRPQSPLQRFVDFSTELGSRSVSVHIGRLGKLKEGKRERLADGKLGGARSQTSVSGTQFYKVEATAPMRVQEVLCGIEPTMVTLVIELQLARLPDGKEHRQVRSGNGAEVGDGTLALFVFEPAGQKGQRLLHVIPFDPRLDDDVDAERVFTERMRDVYAVNARMAALRQALAAVDAAKEGEVRTKALAELQQCLDKRPELLRREDEPLLAMHVAPLEQQARKRLPAGDRGGK
jgi:hypothetical protein